ncbi:chalcone isomerase family protein [Desulfobacula sp.]|uniref:chalcone isomerase family protein n=1 Tax=Desulfobacula sp. TaxID=2593537 RepID=UPI0026377A52|nr:chalcone isomerase family protein [Desulfobacula sp.]
MLKRIVFVLCVLAFVSEAGASKEIAGVMIEDSLKTANQELMLNGAGIRSKMFIKLYVGMLYLEEKSNDAEAIMNADKDMAIRLEIISGMITSEKMMASTIEGFEKSTGGKTDEIKVEIDAFNACFSEKIEKGDVFEMVYAKGGGITVFKNGTLKDTISGMPFKKALFGIWLSSNPADKKLKKGMLGE